jgi:hypothetical protein
MRTRWLAAASVLALLSAVPGTAHAKPFDQGHDSGTFEGVFEECGLTIAEAGEFTVHFIVREVRGSDGQAFLAQDNYEFRAVWTNTANGKWLVVSGQGMFKELTGTHVEGDVWEFTAMDVGQPFLIEDSEGNVVLRERGRITFRALFDTRGDGQPGGELIEEEITGFSGKFPTVSDDTVFCATVIDLIG